MDTRLGTVAKRCALCDEQQELVLSHGMPAGVYRLLGPAVQNGPVSYASIKGFEPLTRQDKQSLMCRRCEEVVAQAENWVLKQVPRRDRFPLLDMLRTAPAEQRWPLVQVYGTQARPEIRSDLLCRFALSIFWRYAVAVWPSGYSVQLGPYAEELRAYLLGDVFPATARLVCSISLWTAQNAVILMPNTTRGKGFLLHQFVVPGLDFMFVIGKQAPSVFDKFCLHHGVGCPLIVSAHSERRRWDQMMRTMDAAEKVEKPRLKKKHAQA